MPVNLYPINRMAQFNCGRKINFTINFYSIANDSINKRMAVFLFRSNIAFHLRIVYIYVRHYKMRPNRFNDMYVVTFAIID